MLTSLLAQTDPRGLGHYVPGTQPGSAVPTAWENCVPRAYAGFTLMTPQGVQIEDGRRVPTRRRC
jgi:hypothetical protein